MRDFKLSDELEDNVGGNELPRHQVMKRVWAHIKDNKLQDPKLNLGFGMTKF